MQTHEDMDHGEAGTLSDAVILAGGPCDGEQKVVETDVMGLDFEDTVPELPMKPMSGEAVVFRRRKFWYSRPYRTAEWMDFEGWCSDDG